jgi:hypothetical protein
MHKKRYGIVKAVFEHLGTILSVILSAAMLPSFGLGFFYRSAQVSF